MRPQGVFLADGTSDLPLARLLEWICADLGTPMPVTPVDPGRLAAGRTVGGRLSYLKRAGAIGDIVFVHRDAESQGPDGRVAEIAAGAATAAIDAPVVPVVPVRMTEAWLLLDEPAIRQVAAKPNGRVDLELPAPREAERVADPKAVLERALLAASETSGRRRSQFRRDFSRHRSLLIERLDPRGPVSALSAWQALRRDTEAALATLGSSVPPPGSRRDS